MTADPAPHQGGSQSALAFRAAQQAARVRSSQIGIPAHPSGALPRSGVQPDASGQALCPFCHKAYRFSPALLNRQLRCSGCRSIFRVGDDRRTFRVQEATGVPSPEAGTTSKAAAVALRSANVSLNEAAAEAMRALSRHDRPAPPGSETALLAAVQPASAPSADPPTRTLRKRSSGPTLTGEGEREGRSARTLVLALAGAAAAVLLVIWLFRPDQRSGALAAFEQRMSWNQLEQARRTGAFQGEIAPIIGIAEARLGAVVQAELGGLREALDGMRVLRRGVLWVERARFGEAEALLGDDRLDTPSAVAQLSARCSKAGIRILPWSEALAAGEKSQPDGAAGIIRAMLVHAQPSDAGAFDPVALIDAGRLPASISVSAFSGRDGGRMVPSKPPLRPFGYRGRLVRFSGAGWPDGWMVFELQPASAD